MHALRRLKPAKLRAIVDGDPRDVAIPSSRRHRWEAVAKVLEALAWTRLEALDAKGGLLGIIEGDGGEGDEATAPELPEVKGLDREQALLGLMLRAQQVALAHQASTMRTVVEGYQTLAETTMARLAAHEAALDRVLALAHQAAQRVAGATPDEDPNDKIVAGLIDKISGAGSLDEKKLESLVERVGRKLLMPPAPSTNGAAKEQ